jgi:F420-non-reducing hydrogenase iron-sulfur subunit
MNGRESHHQAAGPRILVFSTEKISDPAIDLAGMLKQHYPPSVNTISVPCSSGIKPAWIMYAFERGFDGVFIAADGTDCPYSETCTERTAAVVSRTHQLMDERGIDKARLKMAAICSVCSEAFVKQMKSFAEYLAGRGETREETA